MNTGRQLTVATALLAGMLAATGLLAGQAVSAGAAIGAPRSSVRLGNVTERAGGPWGGLAVEFRTGRIAFSGSGMRGRLTPSGSGGPPETDLGELAASGRYAMLPGVSLELGYAVRAFSSAAGYQRWDMLSVGATVSRDLGTPAVRAVGTLAYVPFVRVTQQEGPIVAVRSDVGVSLAPATFPISVVLGYRVERFRFPDAAGRSEQFEAFTLSAGVRVQRLDGRWTLGGAPK